MALPRGGKSSHRQVGARDVAKGTGFEQQDLGRDPCRSRAWLLCPLRTMGSYHTGWRPITLLVSPYGRTAVPLGLKISTFLKKKNQIRVFVPSEK